MAGVFVIYDEDDDNVEVVLNNVEENLTAINIKSILLHRDIKPGIDKYQYLNQHAESTEFALILLISRNYLQCELCAYFVKKCLVALTETPGKVIPVLIPGGQLPHSLSNISYANVNKPTYLSKIVSAVKGYIEQYTAAVISHQSLPLPSEPYVQWPKLILKQYPRMPVDAYPLRRQDFQTAECQTGAGDRYTFDHKVVFAVETNHGCDMYDKTSKCNNCAKYEVKVNDVVLYNIQMRAHTIIDSTHVDKYFRIMEHIATSSAEDNIKTEYTFHIRIRNKDFRSNIEAHVRFTLLRTLPGDKNVKPIDSKEVVITTKKGRRKTKSESERMKSYDADSEPEDECFEARKRNSIAEEVNKRTKPTNTVMQRKKDMHCVSVVNLKLEHQSRNGTKAPHLPSTQCVVAVERPLRKNYSKGVMKLQENKEILIHLDNLSSTNYDLYVEECEKMRKSFESCRRWDQLVLLCTKMCGICHYKNQLDAARQHLDVGQSLLKRCKYRQGMTGRVLCYVSAICREKGQLKMAIESIEDSIRVFSEVEPGDETGKAFFNEGKIYQKMLETSNTRNTRHTREKAVCCFKKALDNYMGEDVKDTKEIRRCLLNICRVLVTCPMTKCRTSIPLSGEKHVKTYLAKAEVIAADLEEAHKYNKQLESYYEISEEIPKRNDMQISYSKAEIQFMDALYSYNKQNLDTFISKLKEAYTAAKKSRTIAKDCGYKEEQVISQFMDQMSRLLCAYDPTASYRKDIALLKSGGDIDLPLSSELTSDSSRSQEESYSDPNIDMSKYMDVLKELS